METSERRAGDVVVISIAGDGDQAGYKQLRDIIDTRMAEGIKSFVLNLSACTRLDSMGIGEIVRSLFHLTRESGRLKLACVPHKISGLLKITNLSNIFESYDDEEAAIASF